MYTKPFSFRLFRKKNTTSGDSNSRPTKSLPRFGRVDLLVFDGGQGWGVVFWVEKFWVSAGKGTLRDHLT